MAMTTITVTTSLAKVSLLITKPVKACIQPQPETEGRKSGVRETIKAQAEYAHLVASMLGRTVGPIWCF
jgi:hypothetical protein